MPVNDGKVSQKNIAADIVLLSSLARGDVSNVIDSLLDTVPKYLLMGKSVSLGDLGTLRISFSSEGVNSAEEFAVSKISHKIYTFFVDYKNSIIFATI